MKKTLLLIFFLISHICCAQNPNIKRTWHWYFSYNAGLDFSSGTAVADTNGLQNASEGGSSISDTSGNLLFYTDGRTVWNRLYQVMPNGTGLMAGAIGSSTQAALIVPKPLTPNLFYIFTTDELQNNGANGMRYSIVDMNLDGGNGDVTAQKNILLFAPCTEKQAAVNHCNDTSVWAMGHETNSNNFRAYLLTPNGINTTAAVISSIGTSMTNTNWYGQMKFSPDGKMLATAMNPNLTRMELYKFDNMTGILSDKITISDNDSIQVSVSFSPDNSKLYVGKTIDGKLFQYDVAVYDSILIVNSKTLIYDASSTIQGGFRLMQNGPDGKIYINHPQGGLDTALSVINNPNNPGISCNLSFASVNLGGRYAGTGMCDINESYFNQTPDTSCVSTGINEIQSNLLKIFPNPARDWIVLEGKGIKSVEITNALGSTIGSYPMSAFTLRHQLNLSSLSIGIYFLKINMIDERFVVQKLIVQN